MVSTSPCLAEDWIPCPSEANCKACLKKFKPLDGKQIVIQKSKIHKKGLFLHTHKAIKADTVIALVKGRRCLKDPKTRTPYTILVDKSYVEMIRPVKYINHSCQPNSRFQKWCSGDKEKAGVAVVSNRCIESNEEVTIKYGGERSSHPITDCKCGNCVR